MSNKRHIIIIIAIIVILSIALAVMTKTNLFMAGNSNPITENTVYDSSPEELEVGTESSPEIDADDTVAEESKEDMESEDLYNEKIITNISLSMETKEFDNSIDRLNKLISKYEGYVENSNILYNGYSGNKKFRSAQYTIRIPEEKNDAFINEVNEIGNTISQNTSKDDISKRYQDTKSKLKVLETKEKRILKLLEKAEKIEDILKLESELNETIYEKESLIGEIGHMDDKVSYTTIYLDISEVDKYTTGETIETKFGEKLENAFNNSIYYLKLTFENLIIILIYILPFALIGGLIYYIINQIVKRK